MPERPILVDIDNLSKSYRRGSQIIPVLQHVCLKIPEGEFLALMGPSGSGKTTLLNLIAGLDRPDEGTLKVAGVDITKLSEAELAHWRHRHVGFIFQFYNLIPVLTALENVELPLMLSPLSRAARRRQAILALKLVGLADRMDHYPRQLSGGQQQRVAIARALILQPQVLLCDESVSMLDAEIQAEVLALLRDLQRRLGLGMLFVTHDLSVASGFCHRVLVLEGGRIVEQGPGAELLAHPQAAITRTLVEACPRLPEVG